MTGKILKKWKWYIAAGILAAAIGVSVFLFFPRPKQEGKKPSGGPALQVSDTKTAGSESIDNLMSSLGIHKVKEGVEAPGFELNNLEGRKVRLKDYRGKIVLLNFMATWCHWCRKEMPSLQKLYDQFKDKDFVIVAVFSDREGAKAVVPFVKKSGYTFFGSSGLLDPTGRVDTMYRITGTPTSYLINRKGNIIGMEIGYRDWFTGGTRDLIDKLLAAE
ncbi:MAG: TlpA family protein disulfide reductase [Spirochaetes bacterium]|nr:TlpA family protein disulfide reductase [Spirochaetota bacterium]